MKHSLLQKNKRRLQIYLSCFFLSISLFLIGCADTVATRATGVVSISISPSPLVVSGLDTRYQLSLTGKLSDGADIENFSGIAWASSNSSLATVDSLGVVTVHALGMLNVTASYLGVSDSISVEVVDVASLSLSPSSVALTAFNQTVSITALASDSFGRTINGLSGLVWESTNPAIASVDAEGNVISHAVGETTITATYTSVAALEKNINTSGDNLNKAIVVASSNVIVNQSGSIVQGRAKYEDRLYSASGFNSPSFKAIRFATIELLDEKGNLLESTVTNEIGEFKFSFSVPNTYSLRLVAEVSADAYIGSNINVGGSASTSASTTGISIHDMAGDKYSFSQSSTDNILFYSMTLSRSFFGAGVFNLLDVALFSAEYANQVLNIDANGLKIFWEKNAGLPGTYYCTARDEINCFNNRGIYIISETPPYSGGIPDTDEFDDDVILHEFAHFLLENYSVDDSEGGIHFIDQNDSDLRLSWSEGWGAFFPAAVKSWLKLNSPELISSQTEITTYVDTIGDNAGLSHDIKLSNPTANQNAEGFYYASSEAAVARILWSLHEDFSMSKIWDVQVNYFPTVNKPTSLPVFWDGLLASDLYDVNELANLESIFEERKVFFSVDNAELDNTLPTAVNQAIGFVPLISSTLYSDDISADVDYTAFTVVAGQKYQVSTFDLYNGADTLVRLIDENGQVIAANDDADPNAYFRSGFNVNAPTVMASKLTFTAAYSGQYFVEVSFANKRSIDFSFVGHYGSYKLAVVEVN